jgi:hypothetical protein
MPSSPAPRLTLTQRELIRLGDALLDCMMRAAWSESEGVFWIQKNDEDEQVPIPKSVIWECVDALATLATEGRIQRPRGRHADRVTELRDRMKDYYRNHAYEEARGRGLSRRKSRNAASDDLGATASAGSARVVEQARKRRERRAALPADRPSPMEYLLLARTDPRRT